MPSQAIGDHTFQMLIDAVVDYAIFMLSPEGNILTWNSGAERLKGYSADEIIGEHFSRFYTPEDRAIDLPARAIELARSTGRFHGEGWRVRKDGERFWALVVIDTIRDAQGELIGFAKVTRDITERQQAQVDLLESERRYRRLIEAVVDYAIFQLDRDGNVTTWNPGAERIKGYRSSDIIGQHFSRFYTDEDRTAGRPAHALRTAEHEGRYEAEGLRVRKDGSQFWASVVIDPIRDDEGRLVGFAKVTRDITERIENQRRLKETEEQLIASQKLEAVGQLSGGIAHDFNNLLMIVLGNLETVERAARHLGSSPHLDRALTNAKRGAQRAAALTSRLLAFSRRQALDPKPIQVDSFLTGLSDFLQRTLGEQVEIEATVSAGIWTIEADTNHLESAILNLALNARDAMPGGGKLTLEAQNVLIDDDYASRNPELPKGQYVVICISDTGTGMSEEVLNRAFEPFFTTKEPGHGTGLGLSQVYGFIKQSGGHVKIYSEVGHGTCIKLYLPRFNGTAVLDEDDNENVVEPGQQGETILLVEDDHDLRHYLAGVLENLSYRVFMAPNAQTALTILLQEHRRIDLMLTDVVMPGINGRELARRALEIRSGLKILFMTGYSRNAVVHHGRVDADVELIQKPFTQAQIALRLRTLLDQDAG